MTLDVTTRVTYCIEMLGKVTHVWSLDGRTVGNKQETTDGWAAKSKLTSTYNENLRFLPSDIPLSTDSPNRDDDGLKRIGVEYYGKLPREMKIQAKHRYVTSIGRGC